MSNLSTFALEVPALTGETVTQGHADYCAANGHATYTRDGIVAPWCPRCGETIPAGGEDVPDAFEDDAEPEDESERELTPAEVERNTKSDLIMATGLILEADRELEARVIMPDLHSTIVERIETTYGVKADDVEGSIVWKRAQRSRDAALADIDKGAVEHAIALLMTSYGAKSSRDAMARSLEAIAARVREGDFARTR